MRLFWSATVVLCFVSFLFAGEKMAASITEVIDDQNRELVFIDISDKAIQTTIAQKLTLAYAGQCYMQRDVSGNPTGPIVIPKKSANFLSHKNFGASLGIGAGLCLAGCLFVQVAGTEISETEKPEGFYATVGTKVVSGAPACLVGAMWLSGCVFLGKGAIELFLPKSSTYQEIEEEGRKLYKKAPETDVAVFNDGTSQVLETLEIIQKNNFQLQNRFEREFDTAEIAAVESWIKRYYLTL